MTIFQVLIASKRETALIGLLKQFSSNSMWLSKEKVPDFGYCGRQFWNPVLHFRVLQDATEENKWVVGVPSIVNIFSDHLANLLEIFLPCTTELESNVFVTGCG